MNRFKRIIKNPRYLFFYIIRIFSKLIPDRYYLEITYYIMLGKSLNLKNPKTYNEKIQWLKLFDRKDVYTQLVDKISAKDIVSNIIGVEHIIPTIGVWDNFDDIDFDKLPEQFVLKCTHDSGTVIICKNKSDFDKIKAKKKINKALNKNFYWVWREWPYKNIKPRILAEKYMVDDSGVELKDYKFFCFDGIPKALFIATDRATDTRFDFYDMNFNHLPFLNGHENSLKKIVKPKGFDKMVELSKLISKNFCHVRVDFYDINGQIFFGEFTLYHWSGLVPFEPEEWDKIFGDWINLSNC